MVRLTVSGVPFTQRICCRTACTVNGTPVTGRFTKKSGGLYDPPFCALAGLDRLSAIRGFAPSSLVKLDQTCFDIVSSLFC